MMLRAVRSSLRVIRNSPFVRHLLLLPILLLLASSAIAVSCSRTADSSFDVSRRWHSEVQERDGVTTVRTLNGSVWRGVATLSGELTLGTDQDEDEYMFGRIADAAQVGDRIFVLDVRPPVLRMYDVDGRYLATVAGEGDGPGEFRHPRGLEVHPIDHRLYITDANMNRVNVYSPQGEILDTYPIRAVPGASYEIVASDGTVYIHVPILRPGIQPYSLFKIVGFGPEGATGDTLDVPESTYDAPGLFAKRADGAIVAAWSIPFQPLFRWNITPSLALVCGMANDYVFQIRHRDGSVIRVERRWEPVAVQQEERAWYRDALFSFFRHFLPKWQWEGPEIPDTKPAYSSFLPDLNGRIWVIQPGEGRRIESCSDDPADWRRLFNDPCWTDARRLDVFEETGRYLGEVHIPNGYLLNYDFSIVFIDEDLLLVVVKDAEGADCLKRFRLVLP